jgi:hypothetical protein
MRGLKRLTMALAITACVSLPAHADECFLPAPPSKAIDFKNTNDNEIGEMAATLRQFDADLRTYLQCLDFEHTHGHMNEQDYKSKLATYNQRVDGLQRIASEFNRQVKVFKQVKG